MNTEAQACFVCGQVIPDGLQRLMLLEHSLCPFCEKKLVNTTAREDLYILFKEKIKRLWFS